MELNAKEFVYKFLHFIYLCFNNCFFYIMHTFPFLLYEVKMIQFIILLRISFFGLYFTHKEKVNMDFHGFDYFKWS